MLMNPILEKLLLANIKGASEIWKIKNFFTYLTKICLFCVVWVYAEQSYLPQ